MAGKRTARAMKLGTLTMLLAAALPVITVELARMPPSPVTRWATLITAVLGAVVVAYGHHARPPYVGEDEEQAEADERPDGGKSG